MISWFAKNDVAANLLMILIVCAGLFAMFRLIPLEIFPSIEPNVITVNVSLRGSTPEDSELALATRIEEAINDLEGIEEYTSRSGEGGTSVSIEVADGYHPRDILDDIKSRVDAINTFPAEAERPIIALRLYRREVITVTVSGNLSESELRALSEQTRDDLLALPGITQVELDGVRNYEVSVDIDEDLLRSYELSFDEIAHRISANSLDIAAGVIKTEGGEVLIRSKGQAYRKDDFENIPVLTQADGTVLTLGSLASITDGFEESPVLTRFNQRRAASIEVYRVGQESAIDVAKKVRGYIEERSLTLPDNVYINYWDDDSQIIVSRIETLTKNALQGGLLVFILLSLFLRPAVACWVFLGIPISFLGAFFLMPFLGITINLLSLFAFIVVLGIVVDDAIVTGENIYTHIQRSGGGVDAAIKGTHEVAVPVTFGILTTVAAFVPIAFIGGDRGPIFVQIPAVVIPCLLVSLIESKLILPAHLKHIEKYHARNEQASWQQRFSKGFEAFVLKRYQPILRWCLDNRYTTLLFFAGLLGLIIFSISLGHSRYIHWPRVPSETVRFNLNMPVGTPFEVTDTYVKKAVAAANTLKEKYTNDAGESVIRHILSRSGSRGGGTHEGRVRFELVSPQERVIDITSQALVREWRKSIGQVPGAENVSFRAEIGRVRDPIDIRLQAKNYEQLARLVDPIKERLATYPTVFDITDSLANGKQELNIDLKAEASILGLTRSDVLRQVRNAFFGFEAQRVQRGRDDVRVMVRYPLSERQSLVNLYDLEIRTPLGQSVPLKQIADFSPSVGPSQIIRIDGNRSINIRADLDKKTANMTVLREDLTQFLEGLIAQNPGVTYVFSGEGREQSETLGNIKIGTLAAMFMIYCLLAIPFKSYVQPILVMFVIPFAMIGAVSGHWVLGMNLTLMSLLGLVALIGVVVNDSLVLVDFINKRKQSTGDLRASILEAGAARFRPVLLTSLTTFFGLIPLLFETATQAQFLKPMAVSLGFGILFATAITLVLVPINYLLLEDIKYFLGYLKRIARKLIGLLCE